MDRERERADRESDRVRMEREKVCVLTAELARVREELNLCEALREDDAQVKVYVRGCVCMCVRDVDACVVLLVNLCEALREDDAQVRFCVCVYVCA